MDYSARSLLDMLLQLAPRRTAEAPREARGLYGLFDHHGQLRYIGSTSSADQSLYERIHQRHRTGSEGMSHYFSHMYNVGRMWRDRRDPSTSADGAFAKALRNAFIAEHCGAVWIVVPDHIDIAALEREILASAPAHAIAWNGRAMAAYDEPANLVDLTLARMGWGTAEIAAVERQRQRRSAVGNPNAATLTVAPTLPPGLPSGDFCFFALDVETANSNRASICQIGVACVRPDNSIVTWTSYVDPRTDDWSSSMIHRITARTVSGAPTFEQVFPLLEQALSGRTVYQHSSFDAGAIAAACRRDGLAEPTWIWRDSAEAARRAWPELKGNGGHGLASLKRHLGLDFRHHDAGEDARASAEVVLRAEARPGVGAPENHGLGVVRARGESEAGVRSTSEQGRTTLPGRQPTEGTIRHIGTTEITQGNIDNSHIYLRSFFDKFPAEAIGGSNSETAAACEIVVEWGGTMPAVTDLDGQKMFFRKRGWIRAFFEKHEVVAGSVVSVDQIGNLRYRLSLSRR